MDDRVPPINLPLEPSGPAQRLGIMHLMLWTLCSAVYLTAMRGIHTLMSDMEGVYATHQEASSLAQGIVSGAVLAGALSMTLARVRRGPPLLCQPGHWLLLVAAIFTLIIMATMIVLLTLDQQIFSSHWYFFVLGAEFLIPPLGYAIAAKCEQTLRWRILFAILATLTLTQSLFYIGIGLSGGVIHPMISSWFGIATSLWMLGTPILALMILLVSIVERIGRQRRDWLHWLGVITFTATASLAIVQMMTS